MFTVGEVARLTGVTVRTLHHYDAIGLVRPSARSDAGYRLYADADLLRLQQVLVVRELGVPLDQIERTLASADRGALLRQHREALVQQRARLDHRIAAIDRAIRGDAPMTEQDVKQLFAGFDPADHDDEARARWGTTAAYRESARRTKQYTAADWAKSREEADAIYRAIAAARAAGTPPTAAAVAALVEEHRAHIDRWFYPCARDLHRGLGEMYVADPRFTQNLDRWYGEGFARYLRDAICADSTASA